MKQHHSTYATPTRHTLPLQKGPPSPCGLRLTRSGLLRVLLPSTLAHLLATGLALVDLRRSPRRRRFPARDALPEAVEIPLVR